MVNREVVGIVTKINEVNADVERAERWLRQTGCKKIFFVDSKKQEGIAELLEYLREEGDVMPWETEGSIPAADRESAGGGERLCMHREACY